MGKPAGKKKPLSIKPNRQQHSSSKGFDDDTAVFISMSQELKEEGNKLFQRRDYETAMLRFEKALKLLPKAHIDVASLRTNMASCYIQMGIGEYPRAINECNLALEVAPKYNKALIKRAMCFEALNRFDLAWRDVCVVLSMEPSNVLALEIRDRVRKAMEEAGIEFDEPGIGCEVGVGRSPNLGKKLKGKKKKKGSRVEGSEKGSMEEDEDDDDEEKLKSRNEMKKGSRIVESDKGGEEEGIEFDKSENGCEIGVGRSPNLAKSLKGKKMINEKLKSKKKGSRGDDSGDDEEGKSKPEDKEVVAQEKISVKEEIVVARTVKLVLGDDIRWAQMPINCSLMLMRDIVRDRYPNLKGVLIKYRDQEGDYITITTTNELRSAEVSVGSGASLRLYITEVSPDQEPKYGVVVVDDDDNECYRDQKIIDDGSAHIKDAWILEFAQLFKSHVGFDSDAYLDLHGVGMKLYSEAIEDVVSTDDAQGLFNIASDKFQEMAALALFNWGNVHMSKAGKRVFTSLDDQTTESALAQIKAAYDWSRKEYTKAGMRYEEALKIKPDFYEGFLALGQQQFEQAKLCWSYAVRNKIESEESSSSEVLQLYNKAEDNMETGMQMWEEMEERRLNGLSKEENYKPHLLKLGLDGLLRELSGNEALEQSKIMRAQILILWGSLLYERSIVEFKLGLPTWEECLEVAVEKFELAGASNTDVAVMVKNHCAHQTVQQGLGFRIDEIVQAWHDMYDAKRWLLGVPSFRLESLFRRRAPRLQQVLEQHV